ncbi:hypothetical protein A4S06_07560 [Erysipelotrichaceae bacterium MTC7]|nr:hypothetical protein A4S06_07560 [Erysipelotrichaceae bacterium MTC7]
MKKIKIFMVLSLMLTVFVGFMNHATNVKAATPVICESTDNGMSMKVGDKLSEHIPDIAFARFVIKNVLGGSAVDQTPETYILTEQDLTKISNYKNMNITADSVDESSNYHVQSLEGIHNFENLQTFRISQSKTPSDSRLTSLPMELSRLNKSLISLTVYSSGLKEVPDVVSCLTNLTTLNFGYNQITEGVDNVLPLLQLKTLILLGNYISEVPAGIGALTQLDQLSFAFNRLTEIPEEVYTLPNVRILAFATNQITHINGAENIVSPNLTQFTLAFNQIADFSPILGLGTGGQFANQYRIAKPIMVEEGTTVVDVDLKDYVFNHMGARIEGNADTVLYFPDMVTEFTFYDVNQSYYSHYNTPRIVNSERENAITIDRKEKESVIKLEIKENEQFGRHVMFRLEATGEKTDDLHNWSSFGVYNNDITYIVPIEEYVIPTTGYIVHYWKDAIGTGIDHENYLGTHRSEEIYMNGDEVELNDELKNLFLNKDQYFVLDRVSAEKLTIDIEILDNNVFHVVYRRDLPAIAPDPEVKDEPKVEPKQEIVGLPSIATYDTVDVLFYLLLISAMSVSILVLVKAKGQKR